MRNTVKLAALRATAVLALAACSSGQPGRHGVRLRGGAARTQQEHRVRPGRRRRRVLHHHAVRHQGQGRRARRHRDTQGPQKFDPTLQKPIVDSVVASKPDAMLIAPTDVTAMQAPLEQAAKAGIKVVLVDTTVDDPSFAVSQISSDNVGGGEAAFDAIKAAKPGGGKVLVISVDPGISTTDARVKGFEDAVGQGLGFKYLGVQYSHNDPATAANLVSAALQKDPDIVGIFATNLFSAEGSATGVRQAGGKDSQDRRLRRGPEPDQGAQGRHRAGARRPAAGDHRLGRRGAGRRRARRQDRDARRSRPGSRSSPRRTWPARVARRRTSRPADPVTPLPRGRRALRAAAAPLSRPESRLSRPMRQPSPSPHFGSGAKVKVPAWGGKVDASGSGDVDQGRVAGGVHLDGRDGRAAAQRRLQAGRLVLGQEPALDAALERPAGVVAPQVEAGRGCGALTGPPTHTSPLRVSGT